MLLLGGSNTSKINPEWLTPGFDIEKEMAFTIEEAHSYIEKQQPKHDVIIFQLISNDIKKHAHDIVVRLKTA